MSLGLGDMEKLLGGYYARGDVDPCASEDQLLRYVSGDMLPGEIEGFRRHLDGCTVCSADMENYQAAESVWAGTENHATGWFARWRTSPAARWVLAAAAAVVVLVVLVSVFLPFGGGEGEGRLRVKGSWQLHVAAERDGRTFRVTGDTRLRTGDRLGFFYSAENSGYLMILFVDESGDILRLYPAREEQSAHALAGQKIRVPDGAVLSPAGGCEWVVGVFSPAAIETREVRGILERLLEQRQECRLDPELSRRSDMELKVIQVKR